MRPTLAIGRALPRSPLALRVVAPWALVFTAIAIVASAGTSEAAIPSSALARMTGFGGFLADIRHADAVVAARVLTQWPDSEHAGGAGAGGPGDTVIAKVLVQKVYRGSAVRAGDILMVRANLDSLGHAGAWVLPKAWNGYGYGYQDFPEDGKDAVMLLRFGSGTVDVIRLVQRSGTILRSYCSVADADDHAVAIVMTELMCRLTLAKEPQEEWVRVVFNDWYRVASHLDGTDHACRSVIARYEGTAIQRAKGNGWNYVSWIAPRMSEPARRRLVRVLAGRCDSALVTSNKIARQARADSLRRAEERAQMSPARRAKADRRAAMLSSEVHVGDFEPKLWVDLLAFAPGMIDDCMDSTGARLRAEERGESFMREDEIKLILSRARAWVGTSRPARETTVARPRPR